MNDEAFKKVLKLSEDFFGSTTDPDQMPINQESANKLYSIDKDTVVYKFDSDNNPVAWIVTVPTSINTMNKFIHKEITERELLDIAVEEKSFESLYLCGVFVLPEVRRKGFAKELVKESIEKLSKGNKLTLYSWAYSDEGKMLIENLENNSGLSIILREV
jgi:GNAT superfamily N-acetyltransferase